MCKSKNEIFDINVSAIENNEETQVILLNWVGSIGFGEYTLYREKDSEVWKADSECMDNNEHKEFLKQILMKFVENVEVVG